MINPMFQGSVTGGTGKPKLSNSSFTASGALLWHPQAKKTIENPRFLMVFPCFFHRNAVIRTPTWTEKAQKPLDV